jgi:hypothetical protein
VQKNSPEVGAGVSEVGIGLIVGNYLQSRGIASVRATSLSASGLDALPIDAANYGALVRFIEAEFGVFAYVDDVTESNFGTLGAVARFVESRQPFAVG